MSAKSKFQDRLADPVQPGNGCHSWIMSAANLGVMAGLTPPEIFFGIRRALHPSRPDSEIDDAIKEALSCHGGGNHRGYKAAARREVKPIIPDGAAAFNKIVSGGKYSTEEELKASSPIEIPESPQDQQKLFFETMFAQDDFIFCGDRLEPGTPKTIRPQLEWALTGSSGPFCIVNSLSGFSAPKKSGDGMTYRGDACVKTFRHCLVEFDSKTIEEQIRFWSSIKLPVKAIIHTGNKSLHAWIDLSGMAVASLETWGKSIKVDLYEKRLKPLGVDMACSNAARLARLPGVFRAEKNQWQRLLWLAKEGQHV